MEPLYIRIAFPPRNNQPQRIPLRGTNRFAVLPIGQKNVVHRLRDGDAALHSARVRAFGDYPGRTGAHAGLGQHKSERHAGPFTTTDQAVTSLDIGSVLSCPLRAAVASTLQ